ncbi:MAG: class I mannose-6-phosphate isomerase [Oscillospiraceae bacterium]|nr:class I mannose-6-phosphate isomerase [Oscillospiraceae bacterium]
MYPITFENLFYDKIWGGSDFEDFVEDMPSENIGEVWNITCHKHGMSIVKNGEHKGRTLLELMKELGIKLMGTKIPQDEFPLLIKIISAKDKLSVQVHPDDDYAMKNENSLGKTEAWYVLDAKENSEIIIGTKDCNKEYFKLGIENNDLEKYLNRVKIKKGDMYFIKSGLVHAILEGNLILEIEQNSDITYRVFDYGRNRPLHIDKALDVIDFNYKPEKCTGLTLNYENYTKTNLCICKYFAIEKYCVKDLLLDSSDEERFHILFLLDGTGTLEYDDGVLDIKKGDCILVPAFLGKYKIKGRIDFLKTFVP